MRFFTPGGSDGTLVGMKSREQTQLQVLAEQARARPTVEQVMALAGRRGRDLAVLHSAAADRQWGRWTIVCVDPIRLLEVAEHPGPDPFALLAEAIRPVHARRPGRLDLPFVGGWVGWLAYEAGRFVEDLPARARRDVDLPLVRFGLYGSAAIFDHLQGRWYVAGVEWPGSGPAGLAGREGVVFWQDLLREAERLDMPAANQADSPADEMPSSRQVDEYIDRMAASLTGEQFKEAVSRAVEYIGAGDIFQVNLARRLSVPLATEPLTLFGRLCRANPSSYAAYMAFGDKAVLSSSPELFLQVRDGRVITRPIKGTRPRVGEQAADRRAVGELLGSEKDRAELAMIIDLERNDLGRVCRYGSVQVAEPFGLEEHPTVYHLVGTIRGQLRDECDNVDLLRATFPGGSITGAPKVRAMEIIDELEPVVRSVYCGSIGWLGLDGQMTMNIAIRTLIVDGKRVHLYAGGGIVADSQPEMELQETTAKARGMARALMAADRVRR